MAGDSSQVEDIFHEAADLPPEQRDDFLHRRCAGDHARLEHVRSLLRHLDDDDRADFLEQPISVVQHLAAAPSAAPIPERLGHYRIIRLLGEGGMGQVYEAQQDHPRRTVALKLIRPGIASGSMLARFEHEAEILGQLQHPGIAHIYQAGSIDTALGQQPFFAMEFIAGLALVDFADQQKLGTRQRMELLAKVCDAVQHAHHKGVIHRDLKPANILVPENGLPKILDFGVARTTGADLHTVSLHTGVGQLIGTLPYMSPEQVSGDSHQMDARSDVYALGVMLYELLSGRLPHNVKHKSIAEAARIIREGDPTRLSSIKPVFRGDIDTIVSKAIEKDKQRRYQSAAELAADIRRYLNDEPIVARPASAVYQLRKFAKRNKALVGGVAATMAALVGGIIGISILAAREAEQRRLADLRAAEAQVQAYRSSLSAAAAAIQNADASLARRSLSQAPENLRGWEWQYLQALSDRSVRRLDSDSLEPFALSISPDDRWLAVAGESGVVRVWNLQEWSVLHEWPTGDTHVGGLAFSPDSTQLISSGARLVSLWDVAEARLRWSLPVAGNASPRAFHPDGSLIAVGVPGRWQVQLIDRSSGQMVRSVAVQDSSPVAVEFSADGSMLVCFLEHGSTTIVIDLGTDEIIRRLPGQWSLSRDGRKLIGSAAGDLVVTDLHTGNELARWRRAPRDYAINAACDLLAGSESGSLTLHDAGGDQPRVRLPAHEHDFRLTAAHQLPIVITASSDRTMRVWDTRTGPSPWLMRPSNDGVFNAAISPLGSRVATIGWGGVKMWDAQTGAELWTTVVSRKYLQSVEFNHDGTRLAVGSQDGMLFVLEAQTGRQVSKCAAASSHNLAWIGTDRWIAIPVEQAIQLIDLRLEQGGPHHVAHTLHGHAAPVQCVVSSRDQTLLASGAGQADSTDDSADNSVRIWEAATGKPLHVLRGHKSAVNALAFDSTGTLLASGSVSGEVMLWDVAAGSLRARLNDHGCAVRTIAFSPDGARVATACDDMTIRLWDVQHGFEAFVLNVPGRTLRAIGFTPDGRALLASGAEVALAAYELNISPEIIEQRETVRQARQRIDAVASEIMVSDELVAAMNDDATMPNAIRWAALDLVRGRGDQVNFLNSEAWWVARSPGHERAEYRRAIRAAQAVCRLWPDDPAMLNTLALLQYRAGEYPDALATLDTCMKLGESIWGGPHPGDLLVLAMAQHQIGQHDLAVQSLEHARQTLEHARFSGDSDIAALLFEAEALVIDSP